jgi:hypothetical protein
MPRNPIGFGAFRIRLQKPKILDLTACGQRNTGIAKLEPFANGVVFVRRPLRMGGKLFFSLFSVGFCASRIHFLSRFSDVGQHRNLVRTDLDKSRRNGQFFRSAFAAYVKMPGFNADISGAWLGKNSRLARRGRNRHRFGSVSITRRSVVTISNFSIVQSSMFKVQSFGFINIDLEL